MRAHRGGVSPSEAGLSPAELQVLQNLGARRGQLDQREADLSTQLALLAAAEAKLDAKTKVLTGLKADVQALLAQADGREAAETDRLVKVYEGMKPKDAAARMAILEDSVRLPIAAKMKERSLSAIVGQMQPTEAKKLTESLAHRFAAAQTLAQNAAATADAAASATKVADAGKAPAAPKPARAAKKAPPRKKAPADAEADATSASADKPAASSPCARRCAARGQGRLIWRWGNLRQTLRAGCGGHRRRRRRRARRRGDGRHRRACGPGRRLLPRGVPRRAGGPGQASTPIRSPSASPATRTPTSRALRTAPPKWITKTAEKRHAGGKRAGGPHPRRRRRATRWAPPTGAMFVNVFQKAPPTAAKLAAAKAAIPEAPQRPNPIPAGGVVHMASRVDNSQVPVPASPGPIRRRRGRCSAPGATPSGWCSTRRQ